MPALLQSEYRLNQLSQRSIGQNFFLLPLVFLIRRAVNVDYLQSGMLAKKEDRPYTRALQSKKIILIKSVMALVINRRNTHTHWPAERWSCVPANVHGVHFLVK